MERVTRIELALKAWEALVLPLNYTRVSLKLHLRSGYFKSYFMFCIKKKSCESSFF